MGKKRDSDVSGILNVLKPSGMTSHDVVAYVRRILKTTRVGHGGTLDPAAAGVLPVCVGNATKTVQFLQDGIKEYRAELILGAVTDTEDYTGTVLNRVSSFSVSRSQVEDAVHHFTGEIMQVPPMVSALKVDGQRLYDLARQGLTVDREARRVTIYSIEVIECPEHIQPDSRIIIHVACGKGTYVRTLCHDIGKMLDIGGHMGFLLRTRVGDLNITESVTLEKLADMVEEFPDLQNLPTLTTVEQALSFLPSLVVRDDKLRKALNGVTLTCDDLEDSSSRLGEEDIYRVMWQDKLIAVYGRSIDEDNLVYNSVRGFTTSNDLVGIIK